VKHPAGEPPKRRRLLRWLLLRTVLLAASFYAFAALSLVALRRVNPPTTGVQIQRRIESWFRRGEYRKRCRYVPLLRISPDLQHAVIAAEDGRFFQHHGFDWEEIRDAVYDELEEGRVRGASTITQQLVKNLCFTTHRSVVRKAVEFTLVPLAEWILGKQRILELYLNVVEWGPGVYGAEAAAQYHYRVSAARLDPDQAARLAAILPNPRRRKPGQMNTYSTIILERMATLPRPPPASSR